MDLLVAFDPPSSAVSTCFVSLPPAIASSLLSGESLHELVLRLTVQSADHRKQSARLVSWGGGASRASNHLGVHAAFATSIGLTDGQPIRVEAIQHLTDVCDAVVSLVTRTESDYAAVSATAEFAEAALLQQIRVVYPGLVFPLRLPGRRVLELEVLLVGSNGESPEFVYLHAGVEVTVLAPDLPYAESVDVEHLQLPASVRSLPTPTRFMSEYPVQLLASFGDGVSEEIRSVTTIVQKVSSTSSSPVYVPVLILSSSGFGVPKGHVYVPPHVWWELRLAMLDPLNMELLSADDIQQATSALCLLSTSVNASVTSAANVAFCAQSIIYPGMPIDKGDCIIGFTSDSSENERLLETYLAKDPLSKLDVEAHDALYPAEDEEIDGEENTDGPDRTSAVSASSAWSLPGGEKLTFQVVDAPFLHLLEPPSYQCMRDAWPPEPKKETIDQVLRSVRGVSARLIVQRVVQHLDVDLERRVFLLRGAEGYGKTNIARACATILRHKHPLLRTVWVRWRAHAGEPAAASISRVESAFLAARQASPGLIVFDDINAVASMERSTDSTNPGAAEAYKSSAHSHAVSCCIATCLARDPSARCLFVADTNSVLDGELIVPGLVTCTETIHVPDTSDRAAILESMVHRHVFESREKASLEVDYRDDLDMHLCQVAELCDGFSPGDMKGVVQRALLLRQCQLEESESLSFPYRVLCDAAKATVPRSRIGVPFQDGANVSGESWDAVGGLWHAKAALRETLNLPARYPTLFADAPVRMPSGVLLYGPPGTGKSLLATIASRACGLRSITVKGPELLSKYIGESEAEVRRLFHRASALTPCVIIFDEFDALAPRRGGESTGVADRVVNTLLTSLDGVEGLRKGVFVVATSSRPELIDPAVLRPGRIDRWVPVDFPNEEERMEILACLCKDMRVHENATCTSGLKDIAMATAGMSGADIRGALTDAMLSTERHVSIDLEALISAVKLARPSVSSHERERYSAVMSLFDRRQALEAGSSSVLEGKLPVRVALQ